MIMSVDPQQSRLYRLPGLDFVDWRWLIGARTQSAAKPRCSRMHLPPTNVKNFFFSTLCRTRFEGIILPIRVIGLG